MKVIYHENFITIERPIMYFIAPMEIICTAHKLAEIPDDLFNQLSDDEQDSICWFFLDLEISSLPSDTESTE